MAPGVVKSQQDASMLHAFFGKGESSNELVQELVARGNLLTVPPAYVLPPLHRPLLSDVSHSVRPPILDLSCFLGNGRAKFVADLRRACEDWGFMQVVNHGASQGVIKEMWAAAQKFFQLPSQDRMSFYQADPRNVASNATLGWRETFRFRGVWDASDHLPMFCREPVERYQAEMEALASKLNVAMMESLGVSAVSAKAMACNVSKKGVSMHLYPPCPDPSLTLGLADHHDITTFTILLETEEVGGLQILRNGQWVHHTPAKGSLSIILGEQMERLSNGKYQSVRHRVVTHPSKQRMSIATFFLPPAHSKIGPLPHLLDPSQPPRFEDLSIADTLPLASSWFN